MSRAGRVAAVVLVAVLGLSGAASGRSEHVTAAQSKLTSQLNSILDDPRLDGSQFGLTVRDTDTGQTLYDRNGAQRVLPASNAKLYTSSAAMDVLGPNFTFSTSVRRTGSVRHHVLHGSLYLRGTGDPMATAADYDKLAAAVARTGVHSISGALVADDTFFDDARLAPFWAWDDEPYYYSAQTSALNIAPDDIGDTGTVLVDVYPAAHAGGRPRVVTIPANDYVRIHNTATTGAKGSAQTIDATREHGRNVVDVTGSIPLGAPNYASQPTVDQPTGLVANVFRRALAAHGVRVRSVAFRATPSGAATIATHRSPTLAKILVPWLKLSNNMIAEAVTKAMGRKVSGDGTWSAGTAAILAAVQQDGIDSSTLQLYDGSGLGRADYVTPDQTAQLLAHVRSKSWFTTWYDALPIAGEPDQLVGGTLRHRMAGTAAAGNLHGKTGSLTGVSALSGYVTGANGHHLVFSMIENNFVASGITSLEDAVGETLADYGGTSSAVRIAPATSRPAPADRPTEWPRLPSAR